jgi:hypothetical protein
MGHCQAFAISRHDEAGATIYGASLEKRSLLQFVDCIG